MYILPCIGSKFVWNGAFEISLKLWTHIPHNMYFTDFYICVWSTLYLSCDVISLSKTDPWEGKSGESKVGIMICVCTASVVWDVVLMMTSPNGNKFPRFWHCVQGIHRWPVNSSHKGQWRGDLMFSLIYAWINGWVNNREAGDVRRHRAHHDVTVM